MDLAANDCDHFILWWYRSLVTGAFLLIVALQASMLTRSDAGRGIRLVGLVPVLVELFVVYRAARSARIDMGSEGVEITTIFRRQRLAWAAIREVSVGGGSSVGPIPWRVPCFHLVDGTQVRADDIRSIRRNSMVDEVVAAAQRRLADAAVR